MQNFFLIKMFYEQSILLYTFEYTISTFEYSSEAFFLEVLLLLFFT